ncbi:G-protein coupled receptor 35-like [Patiria miniata]|uniref:G-protein coupled receptors family 1 profile domain-containing protein n=1 Tax=Patiria miniata TaxID=46514 RepID=A0A914ACW5_PATMI|nr:G-protein coupled receptor 35-like [Patiria miniata]
MEVPVEIYGNASMSFSQRDFLVCTFFACILHNASDCEVSYLLPNNGSMPLISYDDLSNTTYDALTLGALNGSDETVFNHSVPLIFFTEETASVAGYVSSTFAVVFAYVVPCIAACGVLTNLTYLFTLCRVQALRNVTNFYLTNLAVGDLLLLVTFYVFPAIQYSVLNPPRHIRTRYLVDSVSKGIAHATTFLGVAFCTLVNVERYKAICHPLKYMRVQSWKRAVRLVVLTWVIAVAYGSVALFFDTARVPPLTANCQIWPDKEPYRSLTGLHEGPDMHAVSNDLLDRETSVKAYGIARIVFQFLTVLVNAVLYILTIRKIRKPSPAASENPKFARRRNRITAMLMINGVVFYLCLLPASILETTNIFMVWGAGTNWTPTLDEAFSYVNFVTGSYCFTGIAKALNASLNPIVFNVGSAAYREAFVQAFCCCKKKPAGRTEHIAMQNINTRRT